MNFIAHRINTVDELRLIPPEFGVEIDVRAYRDRLVLTHDPYEDGDELEEYLAALEDRFVVFNIKESGIEDDVRKLADRYDVSDYFLLDVEFPYIYAATRGSSFSKIAIRFSEAEPIETALDNQEFADWVWVDTNTELPLDADEYERLRAADYKICLVCPGRWDRPDDIPKYADQLKQSEIEVDAIMTSLEDADRWSDAFSTSHT
jgi:hypothetical protein